MQQRAGAGLGLALLSAAAFGTSGSFGSSLLDAGWTPGATVTARLVVAAAVLTVPALVLLRGRLADLRRGGRTVVLYGLAAVAGCQLAYFNAIQTLSVAVALLLEYSGVLMVVLWMWSRHGQRPRRLTVAGAVVAVVGLALVLQVLSDADLDPVGVLWGLLAAVGLATYFVLSASSDAPLPPLVVAWGGLAVGGATLALAGATGVVAMAAPRVDVVLLDREVSWVVPVLGLAVVAGSLAYVTGILGARVLGARIASFVGLTEVLFAVAFAWLLLDQSLAPDQLLGGLLVLAGIALVRVDELRAAEAPVVAVTAEQEVAVGSGPTP